ncbi:hypothetical protein HMI56_003858 [Coelomomyces lativittatus]|nr:hypothetical protein HMI56_003858 [Coelomomyces lativittatus]
MTHHLLKVHNISPPTHQLESTSPSARSIPEPSLASQSTLISPLTTIVDRVPLSTSSIPSNQSTTEPIQPCSTSLITPTLDPLSLTPLDRHSPP